MARTRNRDQGNPANEPNSQAFGLLGRILDFLFDRIKILSPPLRAVAYFILLAFFCATTWRMIDGNYAVHGLVLNGKYLAQGCEIRVLKDFFSTNSNGMYYAVLTPLQYYRYKFLGVKLPVWCRQPDDPGTPGREPAMRDEGTFKVTLSWLDNEFSDIRLGTNTEVSQASSKAAPFSLGLIASAYAEEPTPKPVPVQPAPAGTVTEFPSSGDRLVVERIRLGDKAQDMREVEFEIELGNEEKPLLLRGAEAGDLPMRPNLVFGERYYFDVPRGWQGKDVEIEMEVPGLFGKEEEFRFKVPAQYGKEVPVDGNRGSVLILRLAPRAPRPPG